MKLSLSNLSFRLLLIILLVSMSAMCLTLYNAAERRKDAVHQVRQESLMLLQQASYEQARIIEETRDQLEIISMLPEIQNLDAIGGSRVFTRIHTMHPYLETLILSSPDGELILAEPPWDERVNLADKPHFQRAIRNHNFQVGEYSISYTGKRILPVGYPVIDEGGQLKAFLHASIDLSWLEKLAAEYELSGRTITILDRNGTVLSRYPDPEGYVGKSVLNEPIVQTILISQNEGTVEGTGLDGTMKLYAFRPLHTYEGVPDLYIYTGIPTSTVYAPVNQLIWRNISVTIIILILAIALAWFMGNSLILRPIRTIRDVVKRFAGGDMSARTDLVYGQDELRQLAQDFDVMAENFEKLSHQKELILSSAGEGIFGLNEQGIITFANPAAANMLGYKVDEITGQPSHMLCHHSKPDGSSYPEEECPIYAAYSDGLIHRVSDEVFWKKDGTGFPVEYISTPIKEKGALVGAVVVFEDITARKLAEDRIRNNAARAKMLAATSHALSGTYLDYQAVLDTVARRTTEFMGDSCIIALFSDDGQWLDCVAYHNPNPEVLNSMRSIVKNPLPVTKGLLRDIIQTGRLTLVPHTGDEQTTDLTGLKEWFYPDHFFCLLIMPLQVQGRVIGTLCLARGDATRPYTSGDQAFLKDLADRGALAIANARLYDDNQRQLKNLSVLYSSAQKLGQSLNLMELAGYVTSSCVEIFGVRLAWLGQALGDGRVQLLNHFPPEINYPRQINVRWDDSPLGRGPVGSAIRTGQPVIINDIHNNPNYIPWSEAAAEERFVCVAAFPLISRNKPFGGLALYSAQPDYFTGERMEFFQAYAHLAASALENARLYEKAEKRLKSVQALHNIDIAITASLDMRLTFDFILEQVISQLNIHAANILMLNQYTQTLEFARGKGFRSRAIERSTLRVNEGYGGRAILEKRTVSVPNLPKVGTTFIRAPLLTGEDFIAYYGVPLIAKGQVKGLLEIYHRALLDPDPEWLNLLEVLAGQAAIAIDKALLFEDLQRSNIELKMAYDATIEGLSYALDLRDKETEGHSRRVTEMTMRLARDMGMDEAELVHVRRGALLHDIGKLGIPDHILLKPGPLTGEEWEIMRRHPTHAYEMLSPIGHLRPALDIPYCHHEKWDGTGYPRGLKGEQIPLAARIFAIVDVWDAMCSDRPYRKAMSQADAIKEIKRCAGSQFDPILVERFISIIEQPEMTD